MGDIMEGFCLGTFVQGDFVWGILSGGLVQGDFVLEPISNANCWYFVLLSFILVSMFLSCGHAMSQISMLLFFLNGIRSPTPTSHLCSLKHVLFPTFLCTTLLDCQPADVLSPIGLLILLLLLLLSLSLLLLLLL